MMLSVVLILSKPMVVGLLSVTAWAPGVTKKPVSNSGFSPEAFGTFPPAQLLEVSQSPSPAPPVQSIV